MSFTLAMRALIQDSQMWEKFVWGVASATFHQESQVGSGPRPQAASKTCPWLRSPSDSTWRQEEVATAHLPKDCCLPTNWRVLELPSHNSLQHPAHLDLSPSVLMGCSQITAALASFPAQYRYGNKGCEPRVTLWASLQSRGPLTFSQSKWALAGRQAP